jgi:hypothetical protein
MEHKDPILASGKTIPATYQQYLDLKAEYEKKYQRKHDIVMVILSSFLGSAFGLGASVIFWLITK